MINQDASHFSTNFFAEAKLPYADCGGWGWGRNLPTQNFDGFFNRQAKATELADFFDKIYLRTIWYSKYLSIKFDVTMTSTFSEF